MASPCPSSSSPSSSTTASPPRSSSATHTTNPLYIPAAPRAATSTTNGGKAPPPSISHRLYVGNLHPAVSEYDLVQLFNPYGKISKLDLLFHKSGPFKGKPRGYAFVEYIKEEDAALAKVEMEGKEVRGRKVAVSFANKSEYAEQSTTGPVRRNRARDEDFKPTTLSLVKNSQQPQGTDAKIAAMEARLLAMKASKNKGPPAATGQPDGGKPGVLKLAPATAGLPRRPQTKR
ncbi:RNA-binding domain-containing protein [Microstroma glucosiphilum]|uniref:Probable RNA-binding protein 18 n=1 Tax=Pseudomicrostroma glucosiphilum TaxID=1684307 RepID=A0A316U5T6_9BASI|nr:RNA-binding domain-containing protein [Pseudomicrostroma glucosiphilum]PWN19821.1 RNA-binding domain-containing protein [Pseudomicrostroma glucosiphilum]